MEEWRPVVGYEGVYEVSSIGRVARVAGGRGATPGIKKLATQLRGYKQVALSKDNVQRTRNVHQLVAEAFLGPRPEGMEVCHNNQKHGDNRVENLRYDTHKANCEERVPGVRVKALPTHCRRGHVYSAGNTVMRASSGGARICKTCDTEKVRRNSGFKGVDYGLECKNGHVRSEVGVYHKPGSSGNGYCLACRQNTDARRKARKKAEVG